MDNSAGANLARGIRPLPLRNGTGGSLIKDEIIPRQPAPLSECQRRLSLNRPPSDDLESKKSGLHQTQDVHELQPVPASQMGTSVKSLSHSLARNSAYICATRALMLSAVARSVYRTT